MQVRQRQPGERLLHEVQESGDLGGVHPPGMRTGFQGEPKLFGVLRSVVSGAEEEDTTVS